MQNFDELTLQQLTRPEGYDCACGHHHVCALQYLRIGRGALTSVPDMLSALGSKRPFVLCDRNTYAAAGERVCALLDRAGIAYTLYILPGEERISPAEWEVGSAVMHYDPRCDLILAVGSGVLNDIGKVMAHAIGTRSAVVGTAPSMDGYASNSSSMEVDHVKVSLYNHAPAGILLDTDVLAQAPMRMLWAGLGDMAAKYVALCEWRISNLVTGEFYCENIAALMRAAVRRVADAAPGIPSRDPDAVGAIAEGLVIAGIAMAYAGISRPASGLEHYFSHMWEMMALERGSRYDLHGIQVGVGTLLTLKLYEKIRTVTPDPARARQHMASFDPAAWEAQVRRIFGKTADEILKIEAQTRKNDPARHAARLDNILAHWDDILRIIDEELPPLDALRSLMASTGMPLTPGDIGVSIQDTVDAFLGSRDIRDKYLSCSLLWDLGLTEDFAAYLAQVAED
ncbi:MAG: sn-glycerol-1-phosphate dehydrogenase [Candidatus Spyradocola sp.]|nr:sn-glycerol-1-phosphate dehydrogenase [Candidatus Spyradocola sp.]